MNDHELALRCFFKAYRAILAQSTVELSLLAQWYEQIAAAKVRTKELIQANEFLQKARALQLELAKQEVKKVEKK